MAIDEPRRDLLIARDFPPLGGGISRWMAALADGYPSGELIVSTGTVADSALIDAAASQQVDRVPIDIERLKTFTGTLAWARRATELARRQSTQFVWCDTIRPSAYVARRVHRRRGVPYGIMVVGNDLLTLHEKIAANWIKRRIMRAVLGDAAVFVAISTWTRDRCVALLRELDLASAAERVVIVPLGTDPRRWRHDVVGAANLGRRRGLPGARWIVTVARLVEYKGIDAGIRLVARLAADFPELHYAIIGRGPHEPELRALAHSLGVGDRIHLLTDVSDDELPAAYSLGEIYLGLTRETPLDVEGFGISFVEAAACGLPVVGARSGGIPDAVVDGETGLLVDPTNPGEIEAAVRRLLADPSLAQRMGRAGRERVEVYLNWERVVAEMRAVAERETRKEKREKGGRS